MKRKVFCALLALMMLLSACSPSAEKESTPGTTDKPSQGTTSTPTLESTPTPTPTPTPDLSLSDDVIAFGECGENLTWILYDDGTLTISGTGPLDAHNYNNDSDGRVNTPWSDYDEIINKVVIEYGVTNLGTFALLGCGMTSVTIPTSVASIGFGAFYGCWSLTSVTIPDSVTSIGETVFYNCISLTSVTIPNSVISIGERAFWGCVRLTNVTIPASVTSIGERTFWMCHGLTDIYYSGNEAQWNQIVNEPLHNTNVTIHYNS